MEKAQQSNKMSGRTKAALWLLIAPTGLLIGSFILYALTNWVSFALGSSPDSNELFAVQNPLFVALNVFLFIMGLIGVLSWLPGLIVGIVLLATKK